MFGAPPRCSPHLHLLNVPVGSQLNEKAVSPGRDLNLGLTAEKKKIIILVSTPDWPVQINTFSDFLFSTWNLKKNQKHLRDAI